MAARASLGAAACVLVPSREGARRLAHDYGVSERKLRVVHSAIEPLGYPEEPTGELRAVIERGAGAQERRSQLPRVLIGTAGVIGDAKDPALFAEIAGALASHGVTAVWIGDGPARGRLEIEAARTGARLAVTGWQHDPRRLYADLDLFVLTSRAEGCPVVLLEAMASSRPVVAGCIGGIPDVVSDGVSGILIAPGDRPGFVAAIRSLLGDPARLREMGRAGRRIVAESFGTERLLAAVREAYGERS